MPLVQFTENLRRHVDCPSAEVEAATVREALEAVFAGNPQLKSYIVDDQSRLRKHVNVFINGRLARDRLGLSDRIGPADEVFVFQALSGG
jgi:molybdopterin converting factor small subunit